MFSSMMAGAMSLVGLCASETWFEALERWGAWRLLNCWVWVEGRGKCVMGISASLAEVEEWFMTRMVQSKGVPTTMGAVGVVIDIVMPLEEVGIRVEFRGVLVVDGMGWAFTETATGKLWGRFARLRGWDGAAKDGLSGAARSMAVVQDIEILAVQLEESVMVASVEMVIVSAVEPTVGDDMVEDGAEESSWLRVGWSRYKKVRTSLGRQDSGKGSCVSVSALPCERTTPAFMMVTARSMWRVTSKSRDAIVIGRGEKVSRREYRIRALTA